MAKTRRKDQAAATPPLENATPSFENSTAPQSVGDTTAATPDRDRIAMRAYELYLARGAADGAAMDDWLSAERELAGTTSGHGHSS